MNPLDGKVALVTGAAKRVGRAIALKLAHAGMDVAITYRQSDEEAKQVVSDIEQLGRRAIAIKSDFAAAGAAADVHEQFMRQFDSCYALVNNASFFEPSPIGELTADAFDRNIAVNARTPLLLIQKFASLLAAHQTPGRIINFIDIHVISQPLKNYVAYNASKAALQEITMTMSMELAPKITVNAIAPGVVAWAASYTDDERETYMQRVPLARPGTPDDAATAALFLIRDADYCTGQIIKLDGGRLLT